ncbi:hypothetical protein K2X33_03830 [bacterium]|nr:hypothetical protein [bacterium]
MKRLTLLGFCVGILSAASAESSTRYYADFYSTQGARRNFAQQSHVFARFWKVSEEATEKVDISWLPAVGYFNPRGGMPLLQTVPGHNYTVEQTLALSRGRRIFFNGRYGTSEALYKAAQTRQAELESGRIAYKMLDRRFYPGATNCVHAVSGVLVHLRTGLSRGAAANAKVIEYFLATRQMWRLSQSR